MSWLSINWVAVVRWIHILSGISWLGEVVTINFVLVPAVIKLGNEERARFIQNVFPRIFHLASFLSATAVISGALLNYLLTGWKNLGPILTSRWGIYILIGGTLGLLLALFHFFVEEKLEPIALEADTATDEDIKKAMSALKLIPRTGMFVLIAIILLMMIAARGF